MKKVYILFLTILLGIFSFSLGNAAVLFQDNFNDGDYDGWTHIRSVNGTLYLGDWTVTTEGYLQCIPSGDAQNLQLDLPTLPESYVVEFDTRTLVDGGGASLIGFYVHWDTWDNRVEVGYRPGRVYIRQYVDGSSVGVLFADPAPEPDPSEWHHFKFGKKGAICSLYIDGFAYFRHSKSFSRGTGSDG